jgi:hypothetical protein
LHECRALEPQTGAICNYRRWVMVPDYLNPVPALGSAMPMVKIKRLRLERVPHLDMAAQMTIVIPGDNDHFATLAKSAQELGRFTRRRPVVNQIAEHDKLPRFVFIDELREPIRDRRHPPQRDQGTGCALAQFVAKMQVRDREPPLGAMEKRKAAIQKNLIGDERLVWTKRRHWLAIWPGKLSLARSRINRY